ncbi:DUF4377 domain-containing protein [Pedobacter nanyangensis]|uniref:DUF4377 domain-containing protein n=1 Tax=Pedobacter nanyangensis TaxID=1562389 RepID=UPI001F05C5C8|nr:DUF4377 domain-containing protein [Pedobacter nanyangensis]
MKKITSLLIALLTISQFAQAAAKSEIITMEIKENKADCTGVGPMKCHLVKYKSSKDWEYFYSGFRNFKYQDGYRYKVQVKRTKLKNVPADASSYKYEVVKVLSRKKIKAKETDAKAIAFLGKHRWKLLSINNQTLNNRTATMNFDVKKNSISGNTGCNGYGGLVQFTGKNKIAFSNVVSTQMACLDNDIEGEFLKLVSLKNLTYDIADQTFNLYHHQKLVAIFGLVA